MSDKKLNAIKEIEFRINSIKGNCLSKFRNENENFDNLYDMLEEIETLLFDINDFINDLKE